MRGAWQASKVSWACLAPARGCYQIPKQNTPMMNLRQREMHRHIPSTQAGFVARSCLRSRRPDLSALGPARAPGPGCSGHLSLSFEPKCLAGHGGRLNRLGLRPRQRCRLRDLRRRLHRQWPRWGELPLKKRAPAHYSLPGRALPGATLCRCQDLLTRTLVGAPTGTSY